MRYLSPGELIRAGLMDWEAAMADIRATVRLMRDRAAGMVAESVMPLGEDPRSKAYGLPAFVGGEYDASGLKWTVHRPEPGPDAPSTSSITLLNAMSDGRPLGIVDSALVTRVRTAAVSGVAMTALMSSTPRRVAILGAGGQAETHLDMLLALFPALEGIDLWNRSSHRLGPLIDGRKARTEVTLVRHDAIQGAIEQADVILCCTSTPSPILDVSAVRAGRLIVQVGFHEVEFDAIDACDVVSVDLWGEFAEKSAKSLFQMYRAGRFAPQQVQADLPMLLLDEWRSPPGASLYFSSFGLNVFDIACATRLLRRAEKLGLGTELPSF